MALIAASIAFFTSPHQAASNVDDSGLCDRAARLAAAELGIPQEIMLAITRTETGRSTQGRLSPWPWTVNMEGKGVWFETRKKAQAFAEQRYDQGARSFDVGCFQVNHRWHGKNFSSIHAMFDPVENARYAAEFLSSLYAEKGSWPKAAAAYHSRTPEYADKYEARFNRILASLKTMPDTRRSAPTSLTESVKGSNENRFPLLVKGTKAATLGSLVPLSNFGARPFVQRGG